MGRYIFLGLAGLGFLYCLGYGRRATADCISHEKREGTLGLLFLTDLKGHDVVLGKLASTSLRGFYALLAVFPVLAVPLLLGGVTSGEFWRMILVLINTFLFSLAIGIFGSALSRDYRRTMGANLTLMLVLVAMPPAVEKAIEYFASKPFIAALWYSCPAYSFYLCGDAQFTLRPDDFWWSVGVTQGVTWVMVLLASWVVPRSWQDQPIRATKSRWRELWRAWSYGPKRKQGLFRRRLLDANAFYWLAARARLKPAHVWTFLALMGAWWLIGWISSGQVWFDPSVTLVAGLMLNCTLKTWTAIEAGQRLAEDKKSGAFELLLTTPLKVRDILRGQWLALRRQFAGPLVAVIVVLFLFMRQGSRRAGGQESGFWFAGMVMLVADMIAISWVAMYMALISSSHNYATLRAMLRVLILPWTVFGLVVVAGHIYYEVVRGLVWSPSGKFYIGLWCGLGIVADLFFGLTAWWRLRHGFHLLALEASTPTHPASAVKDEFHVVPGPTASSHPGGTSQRDTDQPTPAGQKASAKSPNALDKPGRRFRWLTRRGWAVVLVLVLAGCCWMLLRRDQSSPPALVVSLSQSNALTRVFPTYGGAMFILPDGTLWRWNRAGGPNSPQTPVPVQVGTDRDWIQAASGGRHIVGLRRDGSIWQWGWLNGTWSKSPEKVSPSSDWVSIADSQQHSMALRRDGTLWAWGVNSFGQLGNGLGPDRTNLVQVGTNHDWMAVCCGLSCTFGLRTDGTLWAWGAITIFQSGATTMNPLSFPTRVCRETNWVGFASGFLPLFRSGSGEIWQPFLAPPNGESPVGSCCTLVASNAQPDSIAAAYCGSAKLFEIHPDRTLWERPYAFNPWLPSTPETPRKTGDRSDWISLWSAGGTAFGLTADGTIWTWGIDPSKPLKRSLSSWLKSLQARAGSTLAVTPTPRAMMAPATQPGYQKEPRPLMRVVRPGG
jgi:hypothetical protein